MLGDHTLITAVQVNSGIGLSQNWDWKNTAAEAAYFNAAHRWNWGLIGGQVPYLSGGFASGISQTANGDVVETDQSIVLRQTEQSGAALVAYPFNRARRVEFQGGVTRISFDQITETTQFSLLSGSLLSDSTETTALASPLTLATTSAAFVSDTSSFGATSPVQGERYRLEAAPTFGSVNFTSLLADYRRYFMPVPFYTLAARAIHYGRYGSGSEDTRLFPMYLGYPTLVRGYDVTTFTNADCAPTTTSSCPAFDRLLGSRMLVGNLEFRFPLLRPFLGESRNMYGPLPVELALFADGGVAWNTLSASQTGTIFADGVAPNPFSLKNGVASAGVAVRVNLFGFAVGEFDFTHPFQRPGQGMVFQFNLTPGW
jgi:outer membrane protein assembly factor BamA